MPARLYAWSLLVLAIAAEVSATLSLKGALQTRWLYGVVVVGYVCSFALIAAVIRAGMPLGVVYGIWSAIGVAATAVGSLLLFDEPLTATMVVGLACIIAGVVCVEAGSHPSQAATIPPDAADADEPVE